MFPIDRFDMQAIGWIVLALALAAGAFELHHRGYVEGRQEVQTKFDAFVAETKAVAAQAEADKVKKEAEYAKNLDAANRGRDSALASLRVEQARPRGGFVPIPAAGSGADSRVCFDAGALDAALRKLDSGVSAIVGQGDTALINAKALIAGWPAPQTAAASGKPAPRPLPSDTDATAGRSGVPPNPR